MVTGSVGEVLPKKGTFVAPFLRSKKRRDSLLHQKHLEVPAIVPLCIHAEVDSLCSLEYPRRNPYRHVLIATTGQGYSRGCKTSKKHRFLGLVLASIVVFSLLASFLPGSIAEAWSSDRAQNTSICTASGDQEGSQLIPDGLGGAIMQETASGVWR